MTTPVSPLRTPTVKARIAFKVLGVSHVAGYALVKRDEFPLSPIHIGRKIVFARAALRHLLQTTDDELDRLIGAAKAELDEEYAAEREAYAAEREAAAAK